MTIVENFCDACGKKSNTLYSFLLTKTKSTSEQVDLCWRCHCRLNFACRHELKVIKQERKNA